MGLFDSLTQYRGDRVKLARLAKGMSGEDVANALGVTKQFISKLERGYPPADAMLSQLANVLGVYDSFSLRLAPILWMGSIVIFAVNAQELRHWRILSWLGRRYWMNLFAG